MRAAIAAVLLVVLAVSVEAFETRSGESVLIQEGTTVDDDLLAAGGDISLAGDVIGHGFLAGRRVDVGGTVEGLLAAAGENVRIRGAQQTLTAAGRSVTVQSLEARNAALAGNTIAVDAETLIERDLLAAGNSVSILGDVGRDLRAAGTDVIIGGRVGRDAYVSGTNISVLPGAVIAGNLIYRSQNAADIADGTTVQGQVIRRPAEQPRVRRGWVFLPLAAFLPTLAFGALFLALFPRWTGETAARIVETPGWSALWGLVVMIVTPVAAMVGMFTLIGIPIGLTILAAYLLALMLTSIFSGIAVGSVALRGRSIWLQFLLGLAIIFLIGMIPILGPLVWLAVVLFGLGALWLNLIRRRAEVVGA